MFEVVAEVLDVSQLTQLFSNVSLCIQSSVIMFNTPYYDFGWE